MNEYFGVARIGDKKKVVIDYDIVTKLFSVLRDSPTTTELVESSGEISRVLLNRLNLAENELESIHDTFSKAIKAQQQNQKFTAPIPEPKVKEHKEEVVEPESPELPDEINNLKIGDDDADLESLDLDLEDD